MLQNVVVEVVNLVVNAVYRSYMVVEVVLVTCSSGSRSSTSCSNAVYYYSSRKGVFVRYTGIGGYAGSGSSTQKDNTKQQHNLSR